VRVVVQYPPGGTPDVYGRIMAGELSTLWGQPVVVENRTGAAGAIGTDAVAKASPDGYTLLFAADAPITISPSLGIRLPYDPVRDLAPIVNVAQGPFTLMVHPSVPARDFRTWLALVRSQPGKWSYASSGNGSNQHLAMEWIRTAGHLDLTHVPYKGFGQALTDALSGQVPMLFGGVTASIGLIQSGKLIGIGISGPHRVAALPDVPAIAEEIPGFEVLAWYGFMAPAGTPRDIIRKINADVLAIVRRPEFRARLARDGIDAVGNSPEEFAAQIARDAAQWSKVIKAAGVKAD
jgi:tripartite-type tricarboxylate transporter receptor subunit TctC